MAAPSASEVATQLHEAIACAVYLRSPDASGVVALLLRQGQRVHFVSQYPHEKEVCPCSFTLRTQSSESF